MRDRNRPIDAECIFDKIKFTLQEVLEFFIMLNKFLFHNNIMYFYICEYGYYKAIERGKEWFCICKFLSEEVIKRFKPQDIRTLMDMMRYSTRLNQEVTFNSNQQLINVKNGTIDIMSGELLKHSSDYYFTSCMDVEYVENPSIYSAPNFRSFCNTSLSGNQDKIRLFLQITGCILSNFHCIKKAYFFIGEKNCGKSQALEWTQKVIGEENVCNVDFDKLGQRFNLAEFSRNKVNIVAELPLEPIKDITTFKKLVGGDRIQAEEKGQRPFSFKNTCKLLFAGNGIPALKSQDTTQAFASRLVILYFSNEIPEDKRQPELSEKLYEERNIIFSLAVKELKLLAANNFKFELPEDEMKYLKAYSEESNQIQSFVEEMCIFSPQCTCHTKKLYDAYKSYCDDNCLFAHSMSAFAKAIVCMKGIEHDRYVIDGKRARGFKGIMLKDSLYKHQDSDNKYMSAKESKTDVPSVHSVRE